MTTKQYLFTDILCYPLGKSILLVRFENIVYTLFSYIELCKLKKKIEVAKSMSLYTGLYIYYNDTYINYIFT